ncbi:proteoglycan 3 isoform X2 [Sus scrofa]|uniref:Proteoglycan 3 n=1 Tax=Sus scrofa TaxID=9823 RepID=A0A8X9AEY3_PIG|nr:proteoglycan 3 isoform X1 [Sus scrofa]XP_020938702.1 proteoglycan 3 isoform X2 [Sus scrofa]
MKGLLLLPLLLLGTVSALHLENDAPHQGRGETQADLRQDLEGSGDQERELALNDEVPESEGEARAPSSQDAFVDEEAMESDQAALDENVECPREEDRVLMQASTGGQTCSYVLVKRRRTFKKAQYVCRRCYRGNLISIHNYRTNRFIQRWTSSRNQARFWIGGFIRHWNRCRRFQWSDGSCWNFQYWAPGHPRNGRGRCVSMTSRGGHWRRTSCKRRLPFVCSI